MKRERIDELLSDRALEGLSKEESAELLALLGDEGDDESLDRAAAAVALATIDASEPLPAHLVARIEADARLAVPGAPKIVSFVQASGRRDSRWVGGWIAAAACLVLAATAWVTRPSAPPVVTTQAPPSPRVEVTPPPTPAAERAAMLASKNVVHIDWSPTKDPAAAGATGDVVWSQADQRGFMRFRGLAANDRTKTQYQLWIFDPSQDTKTPIDGGVFDVEASQDDVIVPITPKLRVSGPRLFAVTVEKPGGVVVSKRERIVVTAAAKT